MTHISEPRPAAGAAATLREPHPRWASVRVSALVAGASAAGLGLGVPATVVLLLWIGSPYPDNGIDGALHLGAGLWLLAQGAGLVRAHTFSGVPAPVALAPLLLSAVAAWLVHRGTASAVASAVPAADRSRDRRDPRPPHDPDSPRDPRAALTVAGWVLTGYLSVGALAVAYAAHGPLRVAPLSVVHVPLFAAAAALCGAWTGCGRPPLVRLLRALRLPRQYGEEATACLRAAGIGGGVLLGGGALLAAASLAWHADRSGQAYAQLSGEYEGRIAVFLVAVALLPNMAVWAACYGLGVGFSVGAGSAVAPYGVHGLPLLPAFPLLAALPSGASWEGWSALALPVAAGGAVAWVLGNGGWSLWRTLRAVCGAALCLGAGCAVASAWAGGALGRGVMADVGPTWWLAGVAALCWTVVVAVPGAMLLRWHIAHPSYDWRLPSPTWRPSLPAPRAALAWLPRLPALRAARAARTAEAEAQAHVTEAVPAGPAVITPPRTEPPESEPPPSSEPTSSESSGPETPEAARPGATPGWRSRLVLAGLLPDRPSDGAEAGAGADAEADTEPDLVPPPPDPLPWPMAPPLPVFPPPLPQPPLPPPPGTAPQPPGTGAAEGGEPPPAP
ncbi:DUF6350 family protein [Streptomyces sp. V4-01]|uniref:DUF6350 family protein n=1 Tax=Actinacidiphila polyblastidii TaxID=3110430 RepID=A0ABU7P7G9_9ACTN|nr:DUF6350 family protein [Streptomyces sp. V4-01]